MLKINNFTIKNFKSIKETSLPLKKFTIFIGPNSSGKSSFLQSLSILKRTLENEQSSNQLNASELGTFKDIVTHHNLSRQITFRINEDIDVPHGIGYSLPTTVNVWYELTCSSKTIDEVRFGGNFDDYEIFFKNKMNEGTKAYCRNNLGETDPIKIEDPHREAIHPRMRATIDQNIQSDNNLKEIVRRFDRFFMNGEFTRTLMQDFHYVPFYRVATNFAELTVPYDEKFLLGDPSKVVKFLINNLSNDPDLTDKVSALMERLTGKKIRTRTYDFPDTKGIALEFIKNGISSAITNEGTGPNQAILLLTTLVGTRRKSVIAIDEPEIHLHPSAQTKLAKIMIELGIKEEKQIIFATHSESMIFPFLASVASSKKNSLTKNDVLIYYASIDETTQTTTFEELKINEHGQLDGGLKGFYDSDLELLEEFSDND